MPIPYVPQKSKTEFFIPPTLEDDFASFLEHDIPNVVMSFTLLHDWYDQFEDDYEAVNIRGEIYPDSTKSRYADTDNNLNFRSALKSGTHKGDMLIDPDGNVYLLDWEISPEANNRPSRAVRCNCQLTFNRYSNGQIDDMGYEISEAGWLPVADDIPCNAYRYDGRPEYSNISYTPGVVPNALTILSVQYNDKTKNITIDDTFVWGNETYIVIDIDRVGLNISGQAGVLKIQAKKKAGGQL